MLTGNRAAQAHAFFQNIRAKRFGLRPLPCRRIKQNQRMHIAVARVKHIDALQAVFFFHGGNAAQQRADVAARHGAVHAVIIRRHLRGGGKSVFAPRPKCQPLDFVARHLYANRAALLKHGNHARDFFGHFFGRAVRLAQQNRFGAGVVADIQIAVDGAGGGAVHHFQPGGNNAGGNHGSHGIARFAHIVEARHNHLRRARLGHKLHHHFGYHGKHALAADKHGEQIQPRRIVAFTAQFNHAAIDGNSADFQHIVHREAVFQAMHAAGIFSHIAAYAARQLARRVGRVIQTMRRGGIGNGQIAHARLHRGRARLRIHVHNLIELGGGEHNPIGRGHGAAGQPRARPARHHRNAQPHTGFQHHLHLSFVFRQHHAQRQLRKCRQRIAFIRRDFGQFGEKMQLPPFLLQRVEQVLAPGFGKRRARLRFHSIQYSLFIGCSRWKLSDGLLKLMAIITAFNKRVQPEKCRLKADCGLNTAKIQAIISASTSNEKRYSQWLLNWQTPSASSLPTQCKKPIPATLVRRWAWPTWPKCCGHNF